MVQLEDFKLKLEIARHVRPESERANKQPRIQRGKAPRGQVFRGFLHFLHSLSFSWLFVIATWELVRTRRAEKEKAPD